MAVLLVGPAENSVGSSLSGSNPFGFVTVMRVMDMPAAVTMIKIAAAE
jgi:hypothetical protein